MLHSGADEAQICFAIIRHYAVAKKLSVWHNFLNDGSDLRSMLKIIFGICEGEPRRCTEWIRTAGWHNSTARNHVVDTVEKLKLSRREPSCCRRMQAAVDDGNAGVSVETDWWEPRYDFLNADWILTATLLKQIGDGRPGSRYLR